MSTSLPTFSDGDIFDARDKLSATAARRYCGSSDNGFCSIPCCVTSAATLVPGSKSRPAPSSSSRLPQSTIPGNTWGAFTRFHSASPKTLSMSLSKLMHSVSPQTPTNMYSVPLNTLREDINSGEAGNVLEVVIRFNWAVRAFGSIHCIREMGFGVSRVFFSRCNTLLKRVRFFSRLLCER